MYSHTKTREGKTFRSRCRRCRRSGSVRHPPHADRGPGSTPHKAPRTPHHDGTACIHPPAAAPMYTRRSGPLWLVPARGSPAAPPGACRAPPGPAPLRACRARRRLRAGSCVSRAVRASASAPRRGPGRRYRSRRRAAGTRRRRRLLFVPSGAGESWCAASFRRSGRTFCHRSRRRRVSRRCACGCGW